jgi:hypothetical protein
MAEGEVDGLIHMTPFNCTPEVVAQSALVALADYQATSFECYACPNVCEIVQITTDGRVIARWGGRCDRWEVS